MFRGIAEQYRGYLSACVGSRQSLVPSLTQLLIYSNSNLKYSPLLIGAQHNLIIDSLVLISPHLSGVLQGGFPSAQRGETGELFSTSILGAHDGRWLGAHRPPGTGVPPILGLDETLF